jgi:uncharacterized protein YhjY with autotransporter beta-barrel domain
MKPTIPSLLLALCLSLTTTYSARAQNIVIWTGDAPGDPHNWANAANWNPATVPGPTDDAFIEATASINLPTAQTSIEQLDIFGNGSQVTLVGSATSDLETDGFFVYHTGNLTLSLASGGVVNVADDDNFIGDQVFGSGSMSYSGSGALNFNGTDNSLTVGGGSTGTINQTGGTISVAGQLVIGADQDVFSSGTAAGSGIYMISGTSTLTADEIFIGVGSTSTVTTPVATGLLQITGGIVNATTSISLGVSSTVGAINGDSGVITQSGGTLTTGQLNIGESTGGFGSYTLTGGAFTGTTTVIGDETGASGTLTLTSGSGTATTLIVGNGGTGQFTNSSTMTILTGGGVTVGAQAGSVGTVTQNDGLLDIQGTSTLTVGNDGTGLFNQKGGTVNVGGALAVGLGAGTGTYTFGGGTLNANGGIFLGGGGGTGVFDDNATGLNFTGGVTVAGGSTFNQGADLTLVVGDPVTLDSGAIYNLKAGTLTIGGNMTSAGFSGISADPNAIFNFAGGNVTTSSAWVDELSGAVTADTTINTAGGSATLSGALTGGGMFSLTGGGLLDITAVNSSTASWSVDAVNGTVDLNAATFPSSGDITVEGSGVANVTENATNALSGNVSGAGAFNVTFGGAGDTLELTGNTDLTGVTTLAGGGTLQAANGSFAQITGAGGMTIGGPASTGAVNFTSANNNYTGPTTINSGYTLTANSILGTGLVTNNGTIGANAHTFNIGGNFVSNGTIDIDMHSSANTDVIAVVGTANVSNSSYALLNAAPVTGTFTILTSSGLTATTKSISSNIFVHATVGADTTNPNNLDLFTSTTTSSGIAGLSLTSNQQAVASTLDNLIGQSSQQAGFTHLLNLIGANGTTASQLARNYEQLTPESLQYAQSIAYEHSAFLVSKVDGFDDALHHEFTGFDTSGVTIVLPGFNSGLGRQMQSMLAYDPTGWHPTAPNGVNYYPDDGSGASGAAITPASPEPGQVMSDSPTTAPMPMHTEPHSVVLRKPYSNFSAFIGGDGTIADLNQDQGASNAPSSKASYSSEDAIAGVSYKMTSNLAAGILFDYSHTDATTDSYGSKTKVDSYSPGVFATYGDKGFYVNGLFSYGRNNYSNNRAVPVAGGTANSNPDGNQYTAALDAGYQLNLGQGLTVTPSGGLTYTHLDIDSFSENGAAPADLNVDAQHDDSLRSRLGATVSYLTGIGRLTLIPTLTAMWQHEFLDENAPITSSFNDFSSGAFTIHSVTMGRDSALIGVGLTAQLDNSMAIFVEANADVNENYNAENFVGGFKGSF